jgi:hypothetical protein
MGGISIGKGEGERNSNMAYSPPSNKIQPFFFRGHERAVEVIVELLALINPSGFCLYTLLD